MSRLLIRPFDFDITVAVEGETGPQHLGAAPRRKAVVGPGGAQVIPVKAAVLQHFAKRKMHLCAPWQLHRPFENPGMILPHIQHQFSSRGTENFAGRHPLMNGDRRTEPGRQHGRWRVDLHAAFLRQRRKGAVNLFAVVNAGKGNLGTPHRPLAVRAENLLGAVFVAHVNLGDQLQPGGSKGLILSQTETETAVVPSVAQQDFQMTALFQFLCDVVGLILKPQVVGVVTRGHPFGADAPPVQKRFIHAQSANIQPGAGQLLSGHGQLPAKKGQTGLLLRTGDPTALPWLVLLGGFKPFHIASGLFVRVGVHRHLPVITGARFCPKRHGRAETVQTGKTAVIERFAFGFPYRDPGRRLAAAAGLLHLP